MIRGDARSVGKGIAYPRERVWYGAEHRLVATTLTNLGIADGDLGDAQKKRDLGEVEIYWKRHCASKNVCMGAGDPHHTVFPSIASRSKMSENTLGIIVNMMRLQL